MKLKPQEDPAAEVNAPRLLRDGPRTGAENMAVDEALLASAAGGRTTLRFYEWTPAALSLGYFQEAADRAGHSPSATCDIVRRASGGGAILHDRELTYSLAVPSADRFHREAERYYDLFHQTLIATLAAFDISTCLFQDLAAGAPVRPAAPNDFLCFQRRSPKDVICDGWKIAGSAQRQHGGALLQHGSILLGRSPFAPELPGINDIAGAALTAPALADAWLPRLEVALGLKFRPGEPTDEERHAANDFRRTRFGTLAWTNRR